MKNAISLLLVLLSAPFVGSFACEEPDEVNVNKVNIPKVNIPTEFKVDTLIIPAIKPSTIAYKKVEDITLKMHLYYPPDYESGKRYPTIVLFHGGGWNGGTFNQFEKQAQYLASKGMIAVTPQYRLKNKHHTTPFECVKDGRSAMRYLRQHAAKLGIDPERLAAGGGSAGGHVAAATDLTGIDDPTDDLDVNPRPNALVLFNPVFNNGPGNYGYKRFEERYLEISPYHNIQKGAAPTIVFLGKEDHLIPAETALEYQEKMRQVGSRCELFLYDGQAHGFFNCPPDRDCTYFRKTLLETEKFLIDLGYIVE